MYALEFIIINQIIISYKRKGNLPKNKEISGGKAHSNLIEIFQRSQISFEIRRE